MTVDTVVKIVESEKCGVVTMNVRFNGDVKVDYDFFDKSNVVLSHDGHTGIHENGVVKVAEFNVSDSGVVGGALLVEENEETKTESEIAGVENGDSVRVLESKALETNVCVSSVENGLTEAESPLDDSVSVDKSSDCQQQNLQQESIEIEAKIDEKAEVDPVVGSDESVDDIGDKGDSTVGICLEPFFKPEITPDLQSVCNHSDGMENPISGTVTGQSDESSTESMESKVIHDVFSVPDNSSCGFTVENRLGTETKNCKICMTIKSNNVSDGTLASNIIFGSFGCAAPHAHINFQSDANSSENKLSPDSWANDDDDHPDAIESSASSKDASEPDSSDGHSINPTSGKNFTYWLVKIPRADVGIYEEQIKQSEIKLAENTKTRNAFQAKANQQQVYCRELQSILEAAKVEAKAAHELARNKKREVDNAHTVINLAKNGVTIEDMDSKIHSLEHALQHETHDIIEERKLVREISQLRHQRKQLFANPQQQQEIQQARRNQRDHTEEQLKVLKKELHALRDNFDKADEHVRAAKKKHDDETAVLNDLKHQARSANDIRQKEYVHLQTLKQQRNQKNAAFYKGKNDLRIAYNYAAEGKKDSLERHCANQVETFMEMWNKNDEFRKEYVQGKMRHRLWKQGLLDGTQPIINEVPPSLEKLPDDRVNASIKVNSPTTVLTIERDVPIEDKVTKERLPEKLEQTKKAPVPKKNEAMSKDKSLEKEEQRKIVPVAKTNEAMSKDEVPATSNRIEIEEYKEEPKLTNEEEELIKKANQLKREKEAAELREQRRLKEKAKAEEALERKRRAALKAQAKAEFKSRKEAEQKEKEREKRAKKKEKKRGLNPETPPENEPVKPPEPLSESLNEPEAVEKPVTVTKRSVKASIQKKRGLNPETPENEPVKPPEPLSESLNEPEAVEKPVTVTKRSVKASIQTKQVKLTKPIPVAFRNKGKRGLLRYWPYACIVLISTVLFFLGSFERVQTIQQYISGLLHK